MRVLTKMGVLKALTAAIALLAISFLGHSAQAQVGCNTISPTPGVIYGNNGSTSVCADAYVDPTTHALSVTAVGSGSTTANTATTTASPTYTTGTTNPLSTDTHGGLRALIQDSSGTPVDWTVPVQVTQLPSATVGITTQSCTVACASTLVSGAHSAYGISGSATVAGWILVYDAVACSANGTVTPKKAFAYTVANSTIGISWADIPMVNVTGIAVCFSTTGPYTATASTTAFLSLDYK